MNLDIFKNLQNWFWTWFKWDYLYLAGKVGIIIVAVIAVFLIIGALFYMHDELFSEFLIPKKKNKLGDLWQDIKDSVKNMVYELQKIFE